MDSGLDTVIICLPLDLGSPSNVVSGSTIAHCRECGRSVWISPAGRQRVAQGAAVICLACAVLRGVQVADELAEGTRAEVETHLRRKFSDDEWRRYIADVHENYAAEVRLQRLEAGDLVVDDGLGV